MIIRRLSGFPPTLIIKVGSTSWRFPPNKDVFCIADGDTFQVLSRGKFSLIRWAEMEFIRPEDVFVVDRCGPPIHDG